MNILPNQPLSGHRYSLWLLCERNSNSNIAKFDTPH